MTTLNRAACEAALAVGVNACTDLAIDPAVEPALAGLLLDAQTSGGLLLAVSEDLAPSLLAELSARGVPGARVVGSVRAAADCLVRLGP